MKLPPEWDKLWNNTGSYEVVSERWQRTEVAGLWLERDNKNRRGQSRKFSMVYHPAAESILHCCGGQGKLQLQQKRYRSEKLCAGGRLVSAGAACLGQAGTSCSVGVQGGSDTYCLETKNHRLLSCPPNIFFNDLHDTPVPKNATLWPVWCSSCRHYRAVKARGPRDAYHCSPKCHARRGEGRAGLNRESGCCFAQQRYWSIHCAIKGPNAFLMPWLPQLLMGLR